MELSYKLIRENVLRDRDNALDLMKTILVLQMITAHIVQFFPAGTKASLFSDYVNLTTFSGFVFVFGFVSYKAYIMRACSAIHILKGAFKTLIAFYISGLSYTFFITRDLTKESLIDILLIRRIPGYSEFLLSFACIYILVAGLKATGMVKKQYNGVLLIIFVVVSLGLTFVDYHLITNNILGTIIGTRNYACFPILQYMSYFLTGMYLSKFNKVFNPMIMIISIVGTSTFSLFKIVYGLLPERFPPSIFWIVGGWGIVYMYFLLSKYICRRNELNTYRLLVVGKQSLVFLVVSNIVIFAFRYHLGEWYDNSELGYGCTMLFYSLILIICLILSILIVGIKSLIDYNKKRVDSRI